jgi:hypothetical protein
MSRVPPELGELGFVVVGRTGLALCAESEREVGTPAASPGAAGRQRMMRGEWVHDRRNRLRAACHGAQRDRTETELAAHAQELAAGEVLKPLKLKRCCIHR